jgi:NAD(P)-dependent dehydrogenase (short-subunit alcohol dehydrogenase family)
MPRALITGASRGLGAAIAESLAQRDWDIVITARAGAALARAADAIRRTSRVVTVVGDVGDAGHRRDLAAAVAALGGIDLLVNNASDLGASPLPRLADYPLDRLTALLHTNVVAPLALLQSVLPHLRAAGTVINVTSDAGAEAYEGWGGYGASKAALDQLSAVLAVELPELRVYAFDPGDMRTQMHQDAFPGEDISDRPDPWTVVPAVLRLLERRPASGRYQAVSLLAPVGSQA